MTGMPWQFYRDEEPEAIVTTESHIPQKRANLADA